MATSKGWKPNKTTKPVLYFDLKSGTWYADISTMGKMVSKGLFNAGISMGIKTLKSCWVECMKENKNNGK